MLVRAGHRRVSVGSLSRFCPRSFRPGKQGWGFDTLFAHLTLCVRGWILFISCHYMYAKALCILFSYGYLQKGLSAQGARARRLAHAHDKARGPVMHLDLYPETGLPRHVQRTALTNTLTQLRGLQAPGTQVNVCLSGRL